MSFLDPYSRQIFQFPACPMKDKGESAHRRDGAVQAEARHGGVAARRGAADRVHEEEEPGRRQRPVRPTGQRLQDQGQVSGHSGQKPMQRVWLQCFCIQGKVANQEKPESEKHFLCPCIFQLSMPNHLVSRLVSYAKLSYVCLVSRLGLRIWSRAKTQELLVEIGRFGLSGPQGPLKLARSLFLVQSPILTQVWVFNTTWPWVQRTYALRCHFRSY